MNSSEFYTIYSPTWDTQAKEPPQNSAPNSSTAHYFVSDLKEYPLHEFGHFSSYILTLSILLENSHNLVTHWDQSEHIVYVVCFLEYGPHSVGLWNQLRETWARILESQVSKASGAKREKHREVHNSCFYVFLSLNENMFGGRPARSREGISLALD